MIAALYNRAPRLMQTLVKRMIIIMLRPVVAPLGGIIIITRFVGVSTTEQPVSVPVLKGGDGIRIFRAIHAVCSNLNIYIYIV